MNVRMMRMNIKVCEDHEDEYQSDVRMMRMKVRIMRMNIRVM